MTNITASCKDVLVSIVNGNCSGMIQQAVDSIFEFTQGVSFDVVVIDNATGYEGLKAIEDLGVEVRVNTSPQGFAENHSQVLAKLGGYRYLLLFNDDAFFENNAIGIMFDWMVASEETAISGCYIEDMTKQVQPNAAPFLDIRYFVGSLMGIDRGANEKYSRVFSRYIDYQESQDVDWVTGCCMMISSEFISQQGFLDTGYFMYLEDTDICRRAWMSGWRVRYIAEAHARHYGGLSSKTVGNRTNPKIFLVRQKSRLFYLRRYAPAQWAAYVLFINLYIISKLVIHLLKLRWSEAKELLVLLRGRPVW